MGIRSGDHIKWRSGVAHYRRVVPPDCRVAFGCTEWTRSLGTRNPVEAKQLEKRVDSEFDDRVRAIREAGDPHAVAARIKADLRLAKGGRIIRGAPEVLGRIKQAGLTGEANEVAIDAVVDYLHDLREQQDNLSRLSGEIGDLFPKALSPEQFQCLSANILIRRNHL